ncbi:MAG: hypothetical protein AVDCRST_MAG07-1084 [uncultured Frankineae bacterium]|uniref:Uncharacterized protein n=1 Tax=uncultured Frankineae bacterium TaxID=437475 RepID=A0A6J4KHD0_9ACTN|nr:MAG: hypothetical protein AVDCRST_MAG07-1084 [uncultured Frankineae bacterium]
MARRPWGDDEALLAELGAALRSVGEVPGAGRGPVVRDAATGDPVEAAVVRSDGKAAWSWRGVDTELELASLVLDSCLEDVAAVRGAAAAAPRLLVFDGGGLSLEVEVGEDALVGQLLPPAAGEVALVAADGSETTVSSDDVGCFRLALPSGPVRLRARTAEGGLLTDWLSL